MFAAALLTSAHCRWRFHRQMAPNLFNRDALQDSMESISRETEIGAPLNVSASKTTFRKTEPKADCDGLWRNSARWLGRSSARRLGAEQTRGGLGKAGVCRQNAPPSVPHKSEYDPGARFRIRTRKERAKSTVLLKILRAGTLSGAFALVRRWDESAARTDLEQAAALCAAGCGNGDSGAAF